MKISFGIIKLLFVIIALLSHRKASKVLAACTPQHDIADATDKETPYLVYLYSESLSYSCAGTLIDPYWILTAAHCVQSFGVDEYFTAIIGAGSLKPILTGSYYYYGEYEIHSDISTDQIFLHPDFIGTVLTGYEYDVALINLYEPSTKSLPMLDTYYDSAQIGDQVWAMGWGMICDASETVNSEILVNFPQETTATLHDNSDCDMVTTSEQCAWGDESAYICLLDSGGPVIIKGSSSTEEDTLVGIISNPEDYCPTTQIKYVPIYLIFEWIMEYIW
jgi:V8-like Glu-specific endopeptidase